MNVRDITGGLVVRVTNLDDPPHLVDPAFSANRRLHAEGIVVRKLADQWAWWVKHDHGPAPYSHSELEPVKHQPVSEEDWHGDPIF